MSKAPKKPRKEREKYDPRVHIKGVATPLHCKAYVENMAGRALRDVVKKMKADGYFISYGNLQRWGSNGWMTDAEKREADAKANAATLAQEPAKVLDTVPAEVKAAAAAEMVTVMPTVEELKNLKPAELQNELKRQVMVTSIVGLQVAALRAEGLVTTDPKGFGQMVAELSSAIREARIVEFAPETRPMPGDGAMLIEGTVTEAKPVEKPVSAVVASLQRFRAKQAGSNG